MVSKAINIVVYICIAVLLALQTMPDNSLLSQHYTGVLFVIIVCVVMALINALMLLDRVSITSYDWADFIDQ